ncbi:protein phosphatase 2C domain-containing protein [Streptomyces sp. NPDC016469]|uniref:PP2C family protein-serine/threonine phosphatase n=1 Tax=Streptomyces sp. NPDC016469 TaxID=3157191 RepID=UPI0033F5DBC0
MTPTATEVHVNTTATHATAQHIGDRSHQCDAAATSSQQGVRAYALLDGIGSTATIREWTRRTARSLARTAAATGDAHTALTRVYDRVAAEPGRDNPFQEPPAACAVVAVPRPDGVLSVAWCGDVRAYLLTGGQLEQLTVDHNRRQVLIDHGRAPGPYDRNLVTSYLGSTETTPGEGERDLIGVALRPLGGRLLLASDGAYEPLEDSARDLSQYLAGAPADAARAFVRAAVAHAPVRADNATVLVADV